MHYSLTHCLKENLPGRRVEFMNALGPGRAYVASGGLFTSYPPIKDSPCFSAIRKKQDESFQTVAFLTDIGNDFMYNITAGQLIEGLEEILNRLKTAGCPVVVTPIPPILLEWLTPAKFEKLKMFFYPSSTADFEEVLEGIRTVNRFLKEQQSPDLFLVKGLDSYLGWDRIHYDWRVGHKAWTRMAWALLEQAKVIPESRIKTGSMCMAYCENAVRLVVTDLLKLRSRSPQFM